MQSPEYPSSIIGIIKDFGLVLDKKRGQCFLVENNILEQIPVLTGVRKNDLVIEIGAGAGNLTARLSQAAGFVVAYETDRNFFPVYEKYFQGSNTEFLMQDFLKADLPAKIMDARTLMPGLTRTVVVANIPYQITSAIIEKILYSDAAVDDVCLLMQKDVADRTKASADCPEYSILSIACSLRSEVSFVKNIGRNCFFPKPEVDSTIVRFTPRILSESRGVEEFVIFALVKAAFNQRRKVARNAIINNAGRLATVNGYPADFAAFLDGENFKSVLTSAFAECGIEASARAENISPQQYSRLASIVQAEWRKNG